MPRACVLRPRPVAHRPPSHPCLPQYARAARRLRSWRTPIRSVEDAKALRNIGESIAAKIGVLLSGERLDSLLGDRFAQRMRLFQDVWGAGPATATRWIRQGYTSIESLQRADEKAVAAGAASDVTEQQRVGLRHYADLLLRMDRAEVRFIEAQVAGAARSFPGVPADKLIVEVCGSFRRGKADCGDVDILISAAEGDGALFGRDQNVDSTMLMHLLTELHASGFITDDLSVGFEGSQNKYMGVCRGATGVHRRLDLIVVPHNEMGASLCYFTGSAHTNRSIRLWANRLDPPLSLSQHGITPFPPVEGGVVEKLGPREEDVYARLGLDYVPPTERNA